MGIKFEGRELEIYKKIDEIIYKEWNPIGIEGLPTDEYRTYIPGIYAMKKAGETAQVIAQALYKIETERMGLEGDIDKCNVIATLIKNL
jgi:hypothetical protein